MNDEQQEAKIRAALLQDEPSPMPDELRRRVASIPNEWNVSQASPPILQLSRLVTLARAAVVLVIIGAILASLAFLRGTTVGPSLGGKSSVPSVSQVPTLTVTPSEAVGTWHGLKWSAPTHLPEATSVNDVISWGGGFLAVGQIQAGLGQSQVALWRSNDGITWTRLSVDATVFERSLVNQVVATPSGLVAWGWTGQPVCTGQGVSTSCGPTPLMVWTSPDGLSWTRIAQTTTFKGATIVGLTASARGLVAAGYLGWSQPMMWTSETGASWQQASLPKAMFEGAHFSDVRATAVGYVLAGSIGGTAPGTGISGGVPASPGSAGIAAAWWSSDGRAWVNARVQGTGSTAASLGTVHEGSTGLIALGVATSGRQGSAWTSSDGKTWQQIGLAYYGGLPAPTGIPTLPAPGIADDGTHMVAYGNAPTGLGMWTSSDGATWLALPFSGALGSVPAAPSDVTGAGVSRVFVVPDGLVIVGQLTALGPLPLWHVTALP